MDIGIIGYGEIGKAIHAVLKEKPGLTVKIWDKNASKIPGQGTHEAVVATSDLLFLCVPSWTLRGALFEMHKHLKEGSEVITLAKGIEQETCKTSEDLLGDILVGHPVGVLGGPMIADELSNGKPTVGVIGSTNADLRKNVRTLFKKTKLEIRTTTDAKGVALCGVLKNAYTLAFGIADGMGLGDNAKGCLLTRGLREMRIIMKLLGGKQSTILSEAGIGDLFATGQSPHSRNHSVGLAIGSGAKLDGLMSEGTMSLPCLEKLLKDHLAELPLLTYLQDVVKNGRKPEDITALL